MTHKKVKEIIAHLIETCVSDTECIHIGMSNNTLYIPYSADYVTHDDTVMFVEDGDREIYIAYDKIEYIIG